MNALAARLQHRLRQRFARRRPPDSEALAGRLSAGARVITDPTLRRHYGRDLGPVPVALARLLFRMVPELVVQPATVADVEETLAFARAHGRAVHPRGIASWGLGGALATGGGMVIDLATLDGIGDPDLQRRTLVVEAGAKWGHIDERLEGCGLALMCYPSSRFSTVGGWVATGGYGLTAFLHGHLRNSVDWVELATAAGRLLRVARDDPRFELLFGSEGQLGMITRVQLRLVPRPARSYSHLVYGASRAELFALVEALAAAGPRPALVKYCDRDLMRCLNELHGQLHRDGGPPLFEERDALLVQLDAPEESLRFRRLLAARTGDPVTAAGRGDGARLREAPDFAARLLWHERFSPLKIQARGPSLLAGELLIAPGQAGPYIDAAKQLGRHHRLTVLSEAHFVRTGDAGSFNSDRAGGTELLLILMFLTDRRRRWMFWQHLALIPALVRLGVRFGGRPYGIGIWNTPFLRDLHDAARLQRLARWKNEVDPEWSVNPDRFWRLRSRWLGIAGLAFAPALFARLTDALLASARLRGRLVPRRPALAVPGGRPARFLLEVALKCTGCGNCVAVCPAYQVTRDERTTARLKLRLGERLVAGGESRIGPVEAERTWLCTRCGECERVCQTALPLLAAYDAIEIELERRHRRPEPAIREFVAALGTDPAYLRLIGSQPYRSA